MIFIYSRGWEYQSVTSWFQQDYSEILVGVRLLLFLRVPGSILPPSKKTSHLLQRTSYFTYLKSACTCKKINNYQIYVINRGKHSYFIFLLMCIKISKIICILGRKEYPTITIYIVKIQNHRLESINHMLICLFIMLYRSTKLQTSQCKSGLQEYVTPGNYMTH